MSDIVKKCVCGHALIRAHRWLRYACQALHVSDFPRITYKVSVFVQISHNLIPGWDLHQGLNSVHLPLTLPHNSLKHQLFP